MLQRRRSDTFDSLLGSSFNGGSSGKGPLLFGGGNANGGGGGSKVYIASSKPVAMGERFPSAISEATSVGIVIIINYDRRAPAKTLKVLD